MKDRVHIFYVVTLFLVAALALSACAAPAAPADSGGAAMADEGEAMDGRPLPDDAAEEQVIRYVTRDLSRLNPASESGFGRPWISHMWMPFFLRDRNHDLHPWLATDWEVNDDNSVYTIHINPDATWSDGSPVVAQEAIDFWSWALSPSCISCWTYLRLGVVEGAQAVIDGEADTITGLTAIDDKTLQITLAEPSPTFMASMAHYNTGFVKMEDVNADEFAADANTRGQRPVPD